MSARSFDVLLTAAERQPFSGWDFSYLEGRMRDEALGWNYPQLVRPRLPSARSLLDLGTGGGEFLASLAPLPPRTAATEAYPPNVEIARARLAPLGIEVVAIDGAPDNAYIEPGDGRGSLPFADESFSLVIDRHESYYPTEVFRILERGSTFLTQQVGGTHHRELSRRLGAETMYDSRWNLAFAVDQLERAGFQISEAGEAFPETVFADVGAVAYYLKAIPWQVPGFTIEGYRPQLAALHRHIEEHGDLRIPGHFFYLVARRP
jgi:SAM-dependent methyltransferase